jgi:mevalonate kinase
LLFGEHAAVFEYPAVGIGLDLSMRVGLSGPENGDWRFAGLPEEEIEILGEFFRYLNTVEGIPLPEGGTVRITTDLPLRRGLGSSAALCVALLRSLKVGPGDLWALSHEAERFFHGTPSGIDTGLSIYGGLQAFWPNAPALPRRKPLAGFPLYLLLATIPRSTSTKALVAGVRKRLQDGDKKVQRAIEELGRIALDAIGLFDAGKADYPRFGTLANEAQRLLKECDLSTDTIDKVLISGKEAGALGGKLSGAGGGGSFYLVYDSPEGLARGKEKVEPLLEKLDAAYTLSPVTSAPLSNRSSAPLTERSRRERGLKNR